MGGSVLIIIGLSFLLLAGPGLPLLAALWFGVARAFGEQPINIKTEGHESFDSLDVLIPAHHEPTTLPKTIRSVRVAIEQSEFRKNSVHVALSSWSGTDADLASAEADKIIKIELPGKWRALRELVAGSEASWIAIVDAGSIWPAELLRDVSATIRRPSSLASREREVIAVSPQYAPGRAGGLARLYWQVEARLKRLENHAGGPMSFHGATMFFRGDELRALFRTNEFSAHEWLNDDVVIPLMMRITFPYGRSAYLFDTLIDDAGLDETAPELKRRRRLVSGNLEWISAFYPRAWRANAALGLLASRRVLRLVWAWWVSLFAIGVLNLVPIALSISMVVVIIFGVVFSLVLRWNTGRRVLEAFWMSLRAPWLMTFSPGGWK